MSETMQKSYAQELLEEGLAKGMAQGEARGELKGARDVLRILLEERFGSLPDSLIQQIDACTDTAKLNGCIRQVLRINSIQELQW